MAEHDPDRPDFSDSDRLWLERLRGRPVNAGQLGSDAVREADALRLALQIEQEALDADPALQEASGDAAAQRRWERLRFALRRERARQAPEPWWRRWPRATGMAAAALLAAVVLLQLPHGDDFGEPPVLRGEAQLRELRGAEPAVRAQAFADALVRAGLAPKRYRRARTQVVDVELKPDTVAAAAPVFARLGLEAAPGYWRIEFSAP